MNKRQAKKQAAAFEVRRFAVEGLPLEKPAEGEERKWQMVLPKGKRFHRVYGEMDFTEPVLSAMVGNFRKLAARYKGADPFGVQVNYHHQGGIEVASDTPLERTVAAGWIEDLAVRDDGLWGLVRWTPRARQHILADEFRYLSTECAPDWLDEVTGKKQGHTFFGAALTNTPVMKDMPRVAASDANPEAADAADEGARMDRKLLCASLGLAESATDEDVLARIAALKLAETQGTVKLAESAKKLTETDAMVTKLSESLKTAEAKLAKVEGDAKEREVEAFLSEGVKAGRITPAIREDVKAIALSDMERAARMFGPGAKPMVDLSEKGVSGKGTEGTTTPEAAEKYLDEKVAEMRKEDPSLKFHEARQAVLMREKHLYAQLYPEAK